MKKVVFLILLGLTFCAFSADTRKPAGPPESALTIRELGYECRVSDEEARFAVDVTAEVVGKTEASIALFEGDIALLPPKLPAPLRIEREGNQYRLLAARPGLYHFRVDLVGKITRAEPWNQVSFKGPVAAIASVAAQAAADVELQLLNGTVLESRRTNGFARVKGFLGADQTLALRWSRAQGTAEGARKAVVTADTTATAQITPTVAKYVTKIRYDVIQGKLSQLSVTLPAAQALTRLVGEQIRDWEIKPDTNAAGGLQRLVIQFIKPVEKDYQLTLFSEQTVEGTPAAMTATPPQPAGVERESGSFTISTEDTLAEIESATGLRQINAPAGALAAYQFYGRPFALALKLKRIEPVISVAERIDARLEETRLLASYAVSLTVEKAGIYAVDLRPAPGLVVAEVRGTGVDDWKLVDSARGDGKLLRVTFSNRVLGARKLDIQLERQLGSFPDKIVLAPLRVLGASRESAQIGASSAPGIQLKTAELAGAREIPVNRLTAQTDELLAYASDQPDWKLTLTSERLSARVVAEIFNLVTIGDGIVGGSATIRYGLINQGVQEFDVLIPSTWKNVDFTGPNIRRKEQKTNGLWTIGLQEKAWGGYTLVVTYDYQFDPRGATLPIAGIHAVGVERENGSVAITTAASLKLSAKSMSDSLRRVDETELAAADRGLITRAVVLAYAYGDARYDLQIDARRFDELPVLSAVADRTQLTTVLNDAGELLTEACFMVKNNDKQFQKFKLPAGAKFWSCHVNGQAVKAERDGDWLMVPLLRGANRDQAFAVDIVYAEAKGVGASSLPHAFRLEAPQTDIPNTYAEWQLYAPTRFRVSGFGGNMAVARGTTYDLRDAWGRFVEFYRDFLSEASPGLFLAVAVLALLVALVAAGIRRGLGGMMTVLATVCIAAVLAAMLLPALSRAKAKAQRISAINNLKQIGLAIRTFALDHENRLPVSYEEMMNELSTDKITFDPESGQRFVYMGAGYNMEAIRPESILAYSPADNGGPRAVLMADGSVQSIPNEQFVDLSRRGFVQPATNDQIAQNRQAGAVQQAQLPAEEMARRYGLANRPVPPSGTAPGPVVAAGVATPPAAEAAAGLRPVRIDVPREGQAFIFTKVLNAGREPLTVRLHLMKLQTFQTLLMIVQVTAFLVGLSIWWWQWRGSRNTLALTLGLALMLGAIGNLLLVWRVLHLGLIVFLPIVVLILFIWLTWRFWPRPAKSSSAKSAGLEPNLPPAVALVAFLFVVLTASASAAPASVPAVSLRSATYLGTVDERVAKVNAVLQLSTASPNQKIPLFGDDVAVESFSAKPGDAKLVREANGVAVMLPRRGEATIELKLLVKLGGDVTKRQLGFGVPSALTSRLTLTIDQPEADVEFPTAISLKRATVRQQTRVEAVMGSGDKVDLTWTPRVKRAAEIAAHVISHNESLVTIGGGVVNVRAGLDYQVTQGEMRQARVGLPAGYRLLRVEGESIRTWEVRNENGNQVLVVELLKGAAPNYRLTVETEKMLEALPAAVKMEIPRTLDVVRETGLVAVRGDEELDLSIEHAEEVYRVDASEFGRVGDKKIPGTLNVFRFLKPEFGLQARVAAMRPQIEAVVRNNVRVGSEQVSISATVDHVIKRAGVFALDLSVPPDYRIDALTGTNVLQWTERTDGKARSVEVTLKERTIGNYSLRVELSRRTHGLAGVLDIVGVQPLGAQKLTGYVSVSAEPGVAIKPASFDGLSEIPASTVAGSESTVSGTALAYKFLASEPQAEPGWKLSVAAEAVESWVRAEIVNTLTVGDSLVSGRAVVRYEIQNAPVKELALKIPAAFKNVEISGANIRRRDQEGELWKVEFQSKVHGAVMLTVTWDQPRESKTNRLDLSGISAARVERESGIVAVVARAPLQVSELSASDLKPIDTRDLPDWAGRPDDATVLAYQYARPGYKLALDAKRFAEAEMLQALVENVHLTTVVADDGQMMTEMSLSVRNNGRQHLEVALPAGATVWSAFVAGQPVRPSVQSGKLLLPLERIAGENAPVAIELTYVGTNRFPETRGTLELVSPLLDAPLKNARWEVFLPPDYNYSQYAGTMTRELAAAPSETASFSQLEYRQRESQSKAELAREVNSDLSSAKVNLSAGNVKQALADYNRAKYKRSYDPAEDAETKKIEEDLRRAQGNNLISAQNSFSLNNWGNNGGQQQINGGLQDVQLRYDNSTAEAQWTKLQQAQELAVAKVQPIRVNLPTRGVRRAFTQVLQTESSKPMTIRLQADNARIVSWPRRIAAGLGGFFVLWALVAFVSAGSARKPD